MRMFLAAVALIASAVSALGQSAIINSGAVTSGHVPQYVQGGVGSQTVTTDSGPAGGGGVGLGLSELLKVARGTGTGPYSNQGTGPFGTTDCAYDNPVSTGIYHYLCTSANTVSGGLTGALIAYGAVGTTSLPILFNVNGTTYQFPFVTGGIVGPGTTTSGDIAVWNNTIGTLLKDVPPLQIFGTETANFGLFGPTTGSAANPTFRAMVLADLPSMNAVSLLGNPTGGSAAPENITLGSTLNFSGTTANCTTATTTQIGCVEPDNSTITISAGVISATAQKTLLTGTVQSVTTATTLATCGNSVVAGGSAQYTITLSAASGYASNCGFQITNLASETSTKTIAPNGLSSFFLYPGQTVIISNQSNVWYVGPGPVRWKLTTSVNVYVRPDGADTCDGLTNAAFTSGSGCAFQTANGAWASVAKNFDINASGGGSATVVHTCGSPPCTISSTGQLLSSIGVVFVGGAPGYHGDCTTPTNVKLSPSSVVNADIQITWPTGGNKVDVCGFELAGGSNVNYGVYVSGGAQVNFSAPMQIDAISSTPTTGYPAGIGIGANSGGYVYLNATIFFTANIGAALATINSGHMENGSTITINTSNTPAWGTGFIFASWNGEASMAGTIFNGTGATGNRCSIQYGATVNTSGSGATFFPGNANCSTAAGTVADSAGDRGNYN